jgi:hypothetical protein
VLRYGNTKGILVVVLETWLALVPGRVHPSHMRTYVRIWLVYCTGIAW